MTKPSLTENPEQSPLSAEQQQAQKVREMIPAYHPKSRESKHFTPKEWDSNDGELEKQGWLKQ